MDIEILESLAMGPDRAVALAQLLPGSEDHDYFRALHAQQAGRLDEVDAILEAWPQRHGHSAGYQRLRVRQHILRLNADELRDQFGVPLHHEAEVPDEDPRRATRIASYDPIAFIADAVARSSDLSQVTDEGLYELLGGELDPTRRRALLDRLNHVDHPALVSWIAADLAAKNSSGFGSLRIHHQLTMNQLAALAVVRPEVRTADAWIHACVQRMRLPATVDIDRDRAARLAYLRELWAFVGTLPPSAGSLQAHVLFHLLSTQRASGQLERELFATYIRLPRNASYAATAWISRLRRDLVAQLGVDLSGVTGLAAAPSDEELVRDVLHRDPELARQLAEYFERDWLEAELATAALLYGTGDADRATMTLGPARAAALRERVDLAWCAHDAIVFDTGAPVVLDADVKNVPELVVKVFRVDPLAYFHATKREVDTDLDLDGLAASHELVLRYAEPPIRRVRRRIELPMCARDGTYIVDLIGNGMSSRAVIRKGRLRCAVRIGAQGHVVTIVDEAGVPRPDARAWVGDREYTPDARGQVTVAFSTAPSRVPALLSAGDIATVQYLDLVRETYKLGMRLTLDRESLASGRAARAICRVRPTVADAPVSTALLTKATWAVTITDRWGVATTKSQPLVLADGDAALLDWPVPDDTASVQLDVRATVRVVSEQREEELAESRHIQVGGMHATTATEAMYLARTSGGWVLFALGKSGEPRARRPVTVHLTHRWSNTFREWQLATDDAGRVELGSLPGIASVSAVLGSSAQRWELGDPALSGVPLSTMAGTELVVPLAPGRVASDAIARMSIVEVRGGVPVRHVKPELEALEGGIAIRGLVAGDYWLRAPGVGHVAVGVSAGTQVGGAVVDPTAVVELSPALPVIAKLAHADGGLAVVLRGATAATRVHAIATRFVAAPVERGLLGRTRAPAIRSDRARGAGYVSGRELGDEYRYILERRNARRYPGVLLDKPSLLLNPWSRRATTTQVAAPKAGMAFGASAPMPGAPMRAEDRARGGGGRAGTGDDYASYDFLPAAPVIAANLVPDASGQVIVPAPLGTYVTIVVDDPAGVTERGIALAEAPIAPKDQRLRVALEPARHAMQTKRIAPLRAGQAIVVEDVATATVHLVDSLDRAHAYLLALRDDAALREFGFVTKWHTLAEAERRELYSKYACHELHLFLHAKDRPWFDANVRAYLANKRVKTFVDHFVLGDDVSPWLAPDRLARLNAAERALLARVLPAAAAVARQLADDVSVQPPDPARDARLVDTLLGGAALEEGGALAAAKEEELQRRASQTMTFAGPAAAMAGGMPPPPAQRAAPAKAKKLALRGRQTRDEDDEFSDEAPSVEMDMLSADVSAREISAPMFRAQDKTQEWAETNWWRRTPAESGAEMIGANRLWRDVARGELLSPSLGLATGSFAEAMVALAVIELPFVAGTHRYEADGARMTITAGGDVLAGSTQIVDGELVAGGPPLVVGSSFVRADDPTEWIDGEAIDKYVTGPFAVGVVYTCRVVVANPTSATQRVTALVQIPRGSVPVSAGRRTQSFDVRLEPYGTHGHEMSFYFPAAGTFSQFPVHVARGGVIVAAAPPAPIEVVAGGAVVDRASWSYVSQHGSLAEVLAVLTDGNLASIDLERIAWRMRDRAAFAQIIGALEARRAYSEVLWAYALVHGDTERLGVWIRALGERLLVAGPVLDGVYDGEQLGAYEHLELAPLTNARAHRLGGKLRILNDGLAAQYRKFLDHVAHRAVPTDEDRLALTGYLLAQDRAESALGALGSVRREAIADRVQYDYLAAYASCIAGDPVRARALATPWRELPVDRWRRRFEAMLAMLDEVDGGASALAVDVDSRDQQHDELAARQPAFELAADRDGVVVRQQHVAALELRYFEMDVELLFSRQPFVQSDVSRFSYIEPGHREHLTSPAAEQRVAWPAQLRGKNVVVEAVGAGMRKAVVHYANDLATTVAHQYGRLRARRATDGAALAATYVKVYARKRGGRVEFYKDGYTDLRGWFDYATLSTSDLDMVERFALLVCSDAAGATILETAPPAR